MGFFDMFKSKQDTNLKEAPSSNVSINQNNIKNFLVKAIGFISSESSSRGSLSAPEFDLAEIKKASEADSYIKMALMKYSYLVYKAGYELKSKNDDAVDYIKTRFRLMSFSTGKPVDILFQEISDDLIRYSNAFLIKSRVDKLMPGMQAKGVLADKPVGGYFRVDPDTMRIDRDKNGTIKKYIQETSGGDSKSFQPSEVIHFYIDKDANNAFGTPRIIAAIEDVKVLRRIEGNVLSLIYRFALPIYQWIVGLPTSGMSATDREIEEARAEIERMPLDGSIVTNERTQIKAIGSEGAALDASGYLKYFENRVFAALGVSEAQMGRGTSGSNSDQMEAQTHDTIKYIQRTISIFIENYVLFELLLEGGFNPLSNTDDIVNYVFNEISLDTKTKVENHEMLKFQSNMTTFEEMRTNLGYVSEVDESRLYKNMIEVPATMQEIDAKAEAVAQVAANTAGSKVGNQNAAGPKTAGNGTTKTNQPNKDISTKNRPTNQHGTTSVKIKSSLDNANNLSLAESLSLEEKVIRKKSTHKKTYSLIYQNYDKLRSDLTENNQDNDTLLDLFKSNTMATIKNYIYANITSGSNQAIDDIVKLNMQVNKIASNKIETEYFIHEAEKALDNLIDDIKKKLKEEQDTIKIFDSLEYRIRFLLEFVLQKAYWFAYVKTGAQYNIKKAYIRFNGSNDAENHPSEINTKTFTIKDIPAYHSFCDCQVYFKGGEK